MWMILSAIPPGQRGTDNNSALSTLGMTYVLPK